MNVKKRFLLCVLMFAMMLSLCAVPAMAASETAEANTDVVYFEDGSYLVREVTTEAVSMARETKTTSGSAKTTYYNADHEALWDMTLTGTFSYNGVTATALTADYSYNIYNFGWAFKSANAYCKGNQAIVESVFVQAFFITRTAIVTLTCSPTGVLS